MKHFNKHASYFNPNNTRFSGKVLLWFYVIMIGVCIVLGLIFDDGENASVLSQPVTEIRIEQIGR